MKLVICEKPSVAVSISKVIGASKRCDGYYEGNGYRVSWCIGHLIKMANPDAYDEKYKKWNFEDLPILPSEFKFEVSKYTKKQFNVLKNLMNDKEIDIVINAADAGREGEAIFRLVYNKVKCKKKIKRLWISSMEDVAIKEGFEKLKDGKEYENLFFSAEARMIADWVVGMNLSRLYSCLYKQSYSVGRVQTPTLNMIVKRDEEIKNFKKEKYYTLEIRTKDFNLLSKRIDSLGEVENLKKSLGKEIKITDVEEKEKITKPDKLYDLTTLQRECNKYFGYSAKETLDIAQKLYEKKLITYPRTDSRYLSEDMVKSVVNNLIGKNDFDTDKIKINFNSSKVTDHHAIIPTKLEVRDDLSEKEREVLDLIIDKTHSAFGYDLKEKTTKIISSFDKYDFSINGKVVVDEGFTKYLSKYKKNKKDVILPNVSIGDSFDVLDVKTNEKYTTPPNHFTEDSLLKAMEVAGNYNLDKKIEVERKGLGTPATRAGIIENLILKGYVIRDKKNLVSTHKGLSLVTIVRENFKEAKTTVNWEMKLVDIAKGKLSKNEFLKEIEKEIRETIDMYKTKDDRSFEEFKKNFDKDKMDNFLEFTNKKI